MLVSHVITRLIVGGAQENTVASALGLVGHPRFQVELISGPTPSDQPEGSIQHLVEAVPGLLTLVPSLVRPVSPRLDAAAFFRLRKHFLTRRPTIVHTHSGKAGILGRLAAWSAGVPIVVHTIHGPSFGAFQGRGANAIFRMAERVAGSVTTHFITVAEAMSEQYLSAGIGAPEKFTKIYSGFDLDPFVKARNDLERRRQLGIAPEDIVIGKVGRLFQLKGHDDLFAMAPRILQEVPNAKFLLVGGGEWRDRFEDQARSLGIADRVCFTGLVPPGAVPDLIGVMDVVVHFSRREGLPRVLPQALAAGKPVVAMDADGSREVCLDGQTGFLVPVGAVEAATRRVLQLCQDPVLRQTYGEQGRRLVVREFRTETMVQRINSFYEALVDLKGISGRDEATRSQD